MLTRALKAAAATTVIVAAITLAAQTRHPATPAPSNALPQVRSISIHNSPDGTILIDVGLTRSVPYHMFELSAPRRLVVDLEGARKAVARNVYPAQSKFLERVRVGQWRISPSITRVVADLEGTPSFSVKRQGSGIQIELKPLRSGEVPVHWPRASRSKSARNDGEAPAKPTPRKPAQKSPLAVHRFKGLSASLTGPELPSQDKLVTVTGQEPMSSNRASSSSGALVSGISIQPDGRGQTLVDIASTHSVPYRVFQLADPYRLVVDLKGAHDATPQGVYPVNSPVLKRVRVAQWRPGDPPVVRVVADLQGYPIFDVHAAQPGIRIKLRPRQELGPLIRNPFEFATRQPSAQLEHATMPPNPAMTAATGSPATVSGNSFSGLKVIGFIKKKDSATQAVISDRAGIYFVPNGGTFENTFRVIAITPDAVEVQNIETLDTGWLQYAP